MDLILKEIDRALDRGFHYLAIVATLTLPDVCAALESEDGRSNQERYEAWYTTWVGAKYSMVNSFDIYRLRCGVVHQGILGPQGMQYSRIVFTVPDGGGSVLHACVSSGNGGIAESALQFDANIFCRDVMQSVRDWYSAKREDATVKVNFSRLLQFRKEGLSPHFVGIPVIA